MISLTEKPFDEKLLKEMKVFCQEIYVIPHSRTSNLLHAILGIRFGLPGNIGYFYRHSTKRKIEAIIDRKRPDAIYVQLARMAPYVNNRRDIPKYIDYMDAFSLRVHRRAKQARMPISWLWRLETVLLERYERLISPRYAKRFIIANSDKDYLQNCGVGELQILPNGVDTNYFTRDPRAKTEFDIVFVGNMSYHPNVLAAKYLVEYIAKPLRRKRPGLKVLIAGASPTQEVQNLRSSWITISGFMPDIRIAYQSGKIFVAPIFAGSGLQNKILEAMSMELPCITSAQVSDAIGASENIILTGEDGTAFISHIEKVLDNVDLHQAMAKKGRVYVEENFDWYSCCAPLAKLDQHQDVYNHENWE